MIYLTFWLLLVDSDQNILILKYYNLFTDVFYGY